MYFTTTVIIILLLQVPCVLHIVITVYGYEKQNMHLKFCLANLVHIRFLGGGGGVEIYTC